ncbi:serine/threonine-protein kinase, partial [Planctomycetota bacterium]
MPENGGSAKTTRIGGFEILGRLGQGGMGTVYKARQVSMNRVVALKVLPPKLAKDKSFVQRFIREAQSAASLQHPNIVQGIDVGVADGYYYFAMEFVDGSTVKDLITRQGRVDERRALEIARDVARALEHAHKRGIIHRDIKPDNVMLTAEGEVKLADLGLARRVEDAGSVTLEGTALGTPYYMAPEQVRGQPDVDTRADIYALGASLYHMVTGTVPYDGANATAIITKHVTDPAPSARTANPETSRACDELIARMMAKDRDDRPQTPAELLS